MAVFTEEGVRANIRVRDGRRVFYLSDRDHLTPSARQWLWREGVEILPAAQAKPEAYRTLSGAVLREKPEHMTHLTAELLVPKDHPRIRFRGCIDQLEARILLTQRTALEENHSAMAADLEALLEQVRQLLRAEVMDTPFVMESLCGLTMDQLRERSHRPQEFYGIPHFMPAVDDGPLLLALNLLRTQIRAAELVAYDAFHDRDGQITRPDLLQALNRMSSLVWIWMIQLKKENDHG